MVEVHVHDPDKPGKLEGHDPVQQNRADGQTNRQIAQQLFITPKTVEAHLARAFRKLHIDSRAQLPAALSREEGPGSARQR